LKTIDILIEKSKLIRLQSLELAVSKHKGHLGGTYSCVDLLVSLYYGGFLRYLPIDCPDRDRFILSKGHACLALYSILLDLSIINSEKYYSYGADGGLGGQLDISIPGIDWNTGSLGHALGVAAGMALAAKLDNKSYRVFTILGDAECDEGSIWEAIMFAADHKLNNLICIVDRNRMSVTDVIEDTALFKNLPNVLTSFGWSCFEIDGHSFPEILESLDSACNSSSSPSFIIANTVKGKGVSFMENNPRWHQALPSSTELDKARRQLNG
jgi:transketolase